MRLDQDALRANSEVNKRVRLLSDFVHGQEVRVSGKGRITIPLKMRRSLGLRRGSTLLMIEDEGRILMARAELAAKTASEEFADLTNQAEEPFQELWENEDDEAWNDL